MSVVLSIAVKNESKKWKKTETCKFQLDNYKSKLTLFFILAILQSYCIGNRICSKYSCGTISSATISTTENSCERRMGSDSLDTFTCFVNRTTTNTIDSNEPIGKRWWRWWWWRRQWTTTLKKANIIRTNGRKFWWWR